MVSSENPIRVADQQPRAYYPGLDGLRGIAILLVIGYHIFDFIPLFKHGWLGVDLFFVLSGFLITDILLKTKGQKNYLKNFYIKRVLRIFPIYYLTLIVFILLLPALIQVPYNAAYYDEHQANFWLYSVNWLFIFRHPEETYLLNHLWSLAVEEQFYFVWPWLILVFHSNKKLLWILFFLLGCVVLCRAGIFWFYAGKGNMESLFKFSRVDGLIVGSALAIYMQTYAQLTKTRIRNILIAVISANLLYLLLKMKLDSIEYFPLAGYTTFAVLFALIVHHVITREKTNEFNFLRHPALRYLGKISYGFYIYHWPIYMLFYTGIKGFLENYLPSNLLLLQLCAAFTITFLAAIVSMISYLLIERRFLQLKSNFN